MPFTEKFVELLIRYRNALLLLCVILVGAAWYPSTQLRFERSVENLFRKDDPRYESYRLDKRLFGGIEATVLAYDDPELFSEAGLTRLQDRQQQIAAISGIATVTSVNDVRRPSVPMDGRKLLEQLRSNAVSGDQLRNEILESDLYRGRLVSTDGNTALLLIALDPIGEDPQIRADAIAQLQQICDGMQTPSAVIGGPILVEQVYATLEYDGFVLGVASSLILTLVIAVLFRNVRWTLLPLAIVHVALIWTKAILALYGASLSMVSAPLVAMVTVIGVATSVHIMIRYREENEQHPPEEALRRTLVHIIPAIFWTCLTTAAGFAALLACSITPIQTFATMMALGSMLVFVATIMLVPGAALIFPSVGTRLGIVPAEGSVSDLLCRTVTVIRKYPKRVVFGMSLILVFCSVGVSRLGVATDFTDNFRRNSSIVKSYHFMKDRIGSLETLDVLIETGDGDSKEFESVIANVRALQSELEADAGVFDTMSFVDLLDFVSGTNKKASTEKANTEAGNKWSNWLPSLDIVPEQTVLFVLGAIEPNIVSGFWNRDEKTARIVVQLEHVEGTMRKVELIEHLEETSQQRFPSARVAGYYVLLANVVESLLADQWTTFALSIAAIFVIMSIAFRSISLGLAAMVPNAAPILIVIGTMGWLGLEINIATAMMASVSMGLSVDFSIHYLNRFRRELNRGQDFFAALRSAHGSVGFAMVIANLALIAGFLVLTLSSLVPSVHFGILVSVAMLGGLIGNLIVLPLILRLYLRMNLISTGKQVPARAA